MRRWFGSALAALSFLMVVGHEARAWGPEGHAIIADIAEAHLTPTASAEVKRLLATEGHSSLDAVSSWADDYRSTHPDTGPWHYVDIPLDRAEYNEERDCHFDRENNNAAPDLTCIVAKLPEFVKVLGDAHKSDEERLEALKYVVHFAGDIHQPLHAEDNDDNGGNKVRFTYFGKVTNLHAVWDGGIIERHYDWKLGPHYSFDHDAVREAATELDAATDEDRREWAPKGLVGQIDMYVVEWANASHRLAKSAYDKLPARRRGPWASTYQDYAWPVVSTQLEKAGIRLGEILNEALVSR